MKKVKKQKSTTKRNKPTDLVFERIDLNKGYEPGNVRFVLRKDSHEKDPIKVE
mgnify:CR=1